MRLKNFNCLIIYYMVTEKTLFNILSNSPGRNEQEKKSDDVLIIH